MSENPEGRDLPVKEFSEQTLNAARLYSLLRQEIELEDPWHQIVLAHCAFEKKHIKDGWEFVMLNRKDIEEVGQLFEQSETQEDFREGLIELKEKDLMERLDRDEPPNTDGRA